MRRTSSHSRSWCAAAACTALVGCGFGSSRSAGNPGEPDGDGGGGAPPDAAADAAIDGPGGGPHEFCVGPTGGSICLDAAPTGSVELDTAIDTDRSDADNPCLAHPPASWTDALGPDACFIVGDTVRLTSLRATGTRPLVIVAQHQITVIGTLSVASLRATGKLGAGANPTDCKPYGRDPVVGDLGGGGGAGGSFMMRGADGGQGNGVFNNGGQAAASEPDGPARLRGGCAGQKGGAGTDAENGGGAGGGAVYLVSAGGIDLSTGKIDASGAGGKGAPINDGGGGGGSGGMIVLHAEAITVMPATELAANGGGGGGGGAAVAGSGGADHSHGDDGHDPDTATTAAAGGRGGVVVSQNGGDGGRGAVSQTAPAGGLGGDTGGGGGGGGGGVGYIRSNHALSGATVSPPADVAP